MTTKYLLIGSGRVSTHFQRYFHLLNIDFESWSRQEGPVVLAEKLSRATHVLCLITDSAIESFIKENVAGLSFEAVVHFSGALTTPLAESAHPLMSFAQDKIYDLETYQTIPFVLERGRRTFVEILPGLSNPHFEIEAEQKTLYHALCVMSGNFSTLLWQKAFTDFQTKLGLPKEILLPYFDQVAANLKSDLESALTGPLARGDNSTSRKHLQTLGQDPYAGVYRAVVKAFKEDKDEVSA